MAERGDWRVVEMLPPPYSKCAVSGFSDGPLLDFGVRIHAVNPNVGINVGVLEEAGRFIGMVTGAEHATLREQLAEAEAKAEELESENDRLSAVIEAVDTIESADFRARRKAGRKPRQNEKAVA